MSRFETYRPCARLQPYIRHYVISEAVESDTYKVLPGTSLVMGIQYRGSISYLAGDMEHPLSPVGITGLQDRFRFFKNTLHTGSVLIFFKETGAAAFFDVPLHELFAESLSLDHFIPQVLLQALQEQLSDAETDEERIRLTEHFLISRLQFADKDLLVAAAVDHIYASKGLIRIRHLAGMLHISQDPFEKRFRKVIGATPKKFATIVRFQSVLQHHATSSSLTATAYESGYYDQAHFIKDFRLFTGESPEKFFLDKGRPEK